MKIVVVGNSRDLLDRDDGEKIDACDRVVRINSFRLAGHARQVGTAIDIVSICISRDLVDSALAHSADLISQARELWTPSWRGHLPDADVEHAARTVRRRPEDLIFCDDTGHKSVIMRIYQMHPNPHLGGSDRPFYPTTGFQTLHLSEARFPHAEIFVTGFGLNSDPDLRRFDTSGIGIWSGHDIPAERAYLLQGIDAGRWRTL